MSTLDIERNVEFLLGQIQLNHRPAFEKLYRATSSRLYALILRIVSDQDEAADALQETYLKVWRHTDHYRADLGSAWGWLCQIARNTALDRVRKKQRSIEVDLEEFDSILNTLEADHPDLVDVSDLNRCLKRIKQDTQKALILSYVYGLSHSELTQYMDAPLGTLKAWVRRGLLELRKCMKV
ncbi:sigma-70 family RNA polymerase sigma factor [Gynuella sunshinyii]|uniref:DNA-directed RNA polymerase specialized sigma subunit, sigma24-like protein n=1 Tax=Gynuella sunshinyii YC6258 TaxID=1445510 RepID=A0A0C5VQN6_9GAMM|nr:sigma-70 family RNA polymerase sigma factor [Gynuella sunshinyii]AJQ96576.1 DNA-directed RNA polymerase specialized sigma subunit, sigma24-like protein [Gynuella sunshinyii YC6258]